MELKLEIIKVVLHDVMPNVLDQVSSRPFNKHLQTSSGQTEIVKLNICADRYPIPIYISKSKQKTVILVAKYVSYTYLHFQKIYFQFLRPIITHNCKLTAQESLHRTKENLLRFLSLFCDTISQEKDLDCSPLIEVPVGFNLCLFVCLYFYCHDYPFLYELVQINNLLINLIIYISEARQQSSSRAIVNARRRKSSSRVQHLPSTLQEEAASEGAFQRARKTY